MKVDFQQVMNELWKKTVRYSKQYVTKGRYLQPFRIQEVQEWIKKQPTIISKHRSLKRS